MSNENDTASTFLAESTKVSFVENNNNEHRKAPPKRPPPALREEQEQDEGKVSPAAPSAATLATAT